MITFVIIGVVAFLVCTALKPFFARVWRYWCAIKAQDEEQQREAAEIERLRLQALSELENAGPKVEEPVEKQHHLN